MARWKRGESDVEALIASGELQKLAGGAANGERLMEKAAVTLETARGYLSTKHLCRIDVHTSEPTHVQRSWALRVLAPHPRARVAEEERHRYFPAWLLRRPYRFLMRRLLEQSRAAS